MVGTSTDPTQAAKLLDLSAFDTIGEGLALEMRGSSTSRTLEDDAVQDGLVPNPVTLAASASSATTSSHAVERAASAAPSVKGFASFFKSATAKLLSPSSSSTASANAVPSTDSKPDPESTVSVSSKEAAKLLQHSASPEPASPSTPTAESAGFLQLGKSAFASLLRKPRAESPSDASAGRDEPEFLDDVPSAIAAGRAQSLNLTAKKSTSRKDISDPDAPPPQPPTLLRSLSKKNATLSRAGTRAKTPGPPGNGAGDDDGTPRNIEDVAKDGVLTLLRTASVKRTATLSRANSASDAAAASTSDAPSVSSGITYAAAKAALKAEFNKPSIAELQAELAALRGTDQAAEPVAWFLAPGKKKDDNDIVPSVRSLSRLGSTSGNGRSASRLGSGRE
ncbi:hypothetical protein BC830DRAFT_1094243 [Chytriomyces sp. MP71]|nr:hypothetical protein BC830DRAFT_1094243 [Chytriomyces sp. MP71]